MADRGADTLELPVADAPGPPAPTPSSEPGVSRRRLAVVAVGVAAVLIAASGLTYRAIVDRPQPGAWGGFDNGRIPVEQLCGLVGQPAHLLRCDAAAAYDRMAIAYRTRFRKRLCITDSYRSYDHQVRAQAAKPELTAEPGTSNHGWGLAVDLCGGVNDFGTPAHRWVVMNGPTYGWVHPGWAAEGKPRAEPWHFEFGRL